MNTPNNDKHNYPLCRIRFWWKSSEGSSLKPINHNSLEVPKVFEPTNKHVNKMWVTVCFMVQYPLSSWENQLKGHYPYF